MVAAGGNGPAMPGAAGAAQGNTKGSRPRYPRAFRVLCSHIVISHLTADERYACLAGADFTGVDQTQLRKAYKKCQEEWHTFQARLQTEEGKAAEPALRAQRRHGGARAPRAAAQRAAAAPAPAPAPPAPPPPPPVPVEDDSAHVSAESNVADAVPPAEQRMHEEAHVAAALLELAARGEALEDEEADEEPAQAAAPAAAPAGAPAAAAAEPAGQKRAKTDDDLEYDRIKELAHRAALQYLWNGDINDKERVKGAKLQKMKPALMKIKVMLEEGWVDSNNRRRMFRSVDELAAEDAKRRATAAAAGEELGGESFAALQKELAPSKAAGLRTRTIWLHLKALFGMSKRKQRMRRARNKAEVQVRILTACQSPMQHASCRCNYTSVLRTQLMLCITCADIVGVHSNVQPCGGAHAGFRQDGAGSEGH